ncbi:MAG: [Clostridia bacterium]|nr:[citrate (pro-3S)-lyase] ligase [Clostridia bacterium]
MSDFYISQVDPNDARTMARVDGLLTREGIRRDGNLDYTCAMFDENGQAVATGSCFGNTLRCFAVSGAHQGEGLLNQIVTHLIDYQAARGQFHLFLYTKAEAARFFTDLGFHEIARVSGKLVFMENRRGGFSGYLKRLEKTKKSGVSAAVVMNANPFTFGHQYLAEQAAASCDALHLFVVSEDLSFFPFAVRKRLVELGTAHLSNVILHDCGPYIISSATFPSYFLKDETAVIEGQARLDVEVFKQIAGILNISSRWAGEEGASRVTSLYNRVMAEELPKAGIRFVEIPRAGACGAVISASSVRACLRSGDFETLEKLVPAGTLHYLMSPEAEPVLRKLRSAKDVAHY